VLKHSIHLSSIRNPRSDSHYDYHVYAFVHPEASLCSLPLQQLGYDVQARDTPVNVSHINKNSTRFVQRLTNPNSGCCAEKEFLKLYAYTLTDYPVVVHLDIDTVILKPLDALFDVMLLPPNATKYLPRSAAMWSTTTTNLSNATVVTHPINSFFTRDYNMAPAPGRRAGSGSTTTTTTTTTRMNEVVHRVGMQGGFWVVRPDDRVFDEYCRVILDGSFVPGEGWGDARRRYGAYFGAAQIQGLVPYFYGHFHPDTYVELNRCHYNQMVDSPFVVHDKKTGQKVCTTGEETCQDCRQTDVGDIYSAHFTICQKPWKCPALDRSGDPMQEYWSWLENDVWDNDEQKGKLCMQLHHEWHRIRNDLESSWGVAEPIHRSEWNSSNVSEYYYGYCQKSKSNQFGRYAYKYIPLRLPSQ
jgi:hypothetical protein